MNCPEPRVTAVPSTALPGAVVVVVVAVVVVDVGGVPGGEVDVVVVVGAGP
jgi:hypothetical protein